jgi:hypothetical protein
MTGQSIIRGFNRIAVGAAVVILLIGLPAVALMAGRLQGDVAGNLCITVGAALALYGFFRGLGWVIAGFGRD